MYIYDTVIMCCTDQAQIILSAVVHYVCVCGVVCMCVLQGGSRSPVSAVKRLVTGGGDSVVKIWR